VIFTRAAGEPAHSKRFGPLSEKGRMPMFQTLATKTEVFLTSLVKNIIRKKMTFSSCEQRF
jgi:hypothetical protein